jgi:hypothetical protein
MRRFLLAIVALFFAALLSLASLSVASADPDFGPGAGGGQGNNEPQDSGAKCHPPGQTVDEPGCK